MSLVLAISDGGEYAVIRVVQATTEACCKIGEINISLLPIISSD